MAKKILLFLVGAAVIAAVLAAFFYWKKPESAAALTNILLPTTSEELLDFDCSRLPCAILGPKQNRSGVALQRVEYDLSIASNRFNGLPTVSIVVNRGDKIILQAREQDQPHYYLFIPKLNLGHEFSPSGFPLVIDTVPLKGDYVMLLQDSLDPSTTSTNFQAAVLRVE